MTGVAAGSRKRAFTLMELVVTMGLVTILAGAAAYAVTQNRNQVQVARSTSNLRAEVERVRALSRTAGSRLGTARLNYGAGCALGAGNLLWININPGANTVTLPRAIQYDPATDLLNVTCANWNFGGFSGAQGEASFAFPPNPTTFGFSANGRLAFPDGAAPVDMYVQLQHDDATFVSKGFRVLPSGVICISAMSNPVPSPCDEEVRP
ncbi:MAG: type II secretion system protein [Myxococcota bacterium]